MSAGKGLGSPRRLVRIAAAAALVILVAGGIRAARRMTDAAPLAGVELGMSSDDVRASFRPPEGGFFMVGSERGEPLLVWRPRGRGGGAPDEARFELADGRLRRARFAWRPGTRPGEAARQLGLAPEGAPRWDLGAGAAELTEGVRGVTIVYATADRGFP